MRILIGLAAGLAAVAALAGPAAEPALACSCVGVVPARDLPHVDAAFVGRPVSREVDEPILSSADEAVWTFEVERAVKGTLPARLEIATAVSGASCGLELRLDQRIGLLLDRRGDGYTSSLCRQVEPELLLRHVLPSARVAGLPPERGDDGWSWAGVGSGFALVVAAVAALALGLRHRRRSV